MGIADRLKSIAFQPEEAAEPVMTVAPPRQSSAGRPVGRYGGVAEDPAHSAEMARDIEASLAKCSKKGYAELLGQLTALEAAIPDEAARLAAAIASLAVVQLRPEDIKAAVAERVAALQQHRANFDAGLDGEVQNTRKQYQQSLASAQESILQLEKSLATARRDAADFERALSEIETKSTWVRASHEATFARYHDELNGLLGRIR